MKWQAASLINVFLLVLCLFPAGQFDARAENAPLFSYPQALIAAAGISPEDITTGRAKFKTDPVHREWMQHVHAVLPGLEARQETAIVQIHTSFLYLKNALDEAYRQHKNSQTTFSEQVGWLFDWFQQAHLSVLSPTQSEALFGGPAEEEEKTAAVAAADGPLGFPIENPNTPVEAITAAFDARALEAIKNLHQQRKQEMAVIDRAHAEGSIPAPEFEILKKEIQATYLNNCRDILTDVQFELLFGSSGK